MSSQFKFDKEQAQSIKNYRKRKTTIPSSTNSSSATSPPSKRIHRDTGAVLSPCAEPSAAPLTTDSARHPECNAVPISSPSSFFAGVTCFLTPGSRVFNRQDMNHMQGKIVEKGGQVSLVLDATVTHIVIPQQHSLIGAAFTRVVSDLSLLQESHVSLSSRVMVTPDWVHACLAHHQLVATLPFQLRLEDRSEGCTSYRLAWVQPLTQEEANIPSVNSQSTSNGTNDSQQSQQPGKIFSPPSTVLPPATASQYGDHTLLKASTMVLQGGGSPPPLEIPSPLKQTRPPPSSSSSPAFFSSSSSVCPHVPIKQEVSASSSSLHSPVLIQSVPSITRETNRTDGCLKQGLVSDSKNSKRECGESNDQLEPVPSPRSHAFLLSQEVDEQVPCCTVVFPTFSCSQLVCSCALFCLTCHLLLCVRFLRLSSSFLSCTIHPLLIHVCMHLPCLSPLFSALLVN